jgi:site-specific recombinase XerD
MTVAQSYVTRIQLGYDDSVSLGDMIAKFSNKATNPRYLQAQISETPYSELYAERVAYRAKTLAKLLRQYVALPVASFSRPDVRDICMLILKSRGKCRSAQADFQLVKVIFSQAVEDGLMPHSPADGMADIAYKEKPKCAIPAENLLWLISHREFFPSQDAYDFFVVAATTGMRRGEILGITKDKLFKGTLTIDQQWTVRGEFTPPKWGIVRVIPLAQITQEIIDRRIPGKDGRIFTMSQSMVGNLFTAIRLSAMANDKDDPELWSSLNPHLLRHSINTNLLVAGVSPLSVAEYLAWHHQELLSMQQRYTHLVAMNLKAVSDEVDKMFKINTLNKCNIS